MLEPLAGKLARAVLRGAWALDKSKSSMMSENLYSVVCTAPLIKVLVPMRIFACFDSGANIAYTARHSQRVYARANAFHGFWD
jgi:hypothetical protein